MMYYITKRDGRLKPYNRRKIENAIAAAFTDVDGEVNEYAESKIASITDYIEKEIKESDKPLGVEDIQDLVENGLMNTKRKDVARAYITYRNERTKERDKKSILTVKVMNKVNPKESDIVNSNANVDERSFSGREKEASSIMAKTIALDFGGLPEEVAIAHKEMDVYQHDLEKSIYGIHNCLFANMQRLLKYGFSTKNGDVRGARTYSTACQQYAVIFQCQSQVQFGGVGSIHCDVDLAPYVKLSFIKHYVLELVKDNANFDEIDFLNADEESIDKWVDENKAKVLSDAGLTEEDIYLDNKENLDSRYYNRALFNLVQEGKQSSQALYHNLNTLESRQGSQVPFTSINFGRDTTTEGRLVSKWMLEASLNGIGKYHLTPIFPISIFQYKSGVNANPGDPNYDLKKLALKSMSKRIYPNWVNGDWTEAHEDPDNPDTWMATMGCRTLIGYDRHGMGYNKQGRGNNVPNTIILPKLGILYGICLGERTEPDLDGFWEALDDRLRIAEKGLLSRYEIMKRQSPKAAPFMYKNGTISNFDKCTDTVEESLKHNTLGFGIIGVAEMCTALFGKNHAEDEEVHKFALSVVEHIYNYAKEASERNNLNMSTYFTPAEGLCRTALMSLREQFGIIKDVTSHEFLTNSVHCPVWMKIDIFKKLQVEAPFTKYATAGTITYVELDSDFVHNIDAVEKIIDYAFKELNIPYLAFNFPIDTCTDCGYQDEINDVCPKCGSKNIIHLRRVTGYITTDYRYFNDGKIAEVNERQKHSLYTDDATMLEFTQETINDLKKAQ